MFQRYPKYYMVIENPIDLRTIARKIQDGKYTSLNDMEKDLLLLTKNACTFNEPGSQIYKDAKMLKKIISSRKIEIEHGKSVLEKKSERIRWEFQSFFCLSSFQFRYLCWWLKFKISEISDYEVRRSRYRLLQLLFKVKTKIQMLTRRQSKPIQWMKNLITLAGSYIMLFALIPILKVNTSLLIECSKIAGRN